MTVRRSIALSLGQRYVAAVISFGSAMVLARLLTPHEIGIYSVAAAAIALAHSLRDFGIGRYLVQEKELTELRVRSALGMTCVTAWSGAALLFALRGPIAAFYGQPALEDVLAVLCINFLILPLGSLAIALMQRDMEFGALFKIAIVGTVTHAATGITLAAFGFGYMSLAWASAANGAVSGLAAVVLRPSVARVLPSLAEWRRVFAFGGPVSLAGVVNQLGAQAPDLIVGRILGFAPVAIYSRALGLVSIFNNYFLQGVASVALPAFAARHRDGHELKDSHLLGMSYATAVAWPFFGFLALMALPILRLLFGPQWDAAAPILQLLCLAGAVGPSWAMIAPLLTAMGRVRELLHAELLIQGLRIVLIAGSALHSLWAVAMSQVVICAIAWIVYQRLLSRLVGLSARELLASVWQSGGVAVMSLCPVVILVLVRADRAAAFSDLAIAALCTAVCWFVAVFAFGHPIRNEVRKVCRSGWGLIGRPETP